jgi:hypothetical protein
MVHFEPDSYQGVRSLVRIFPPNYTIPDLLNICLAHHFAVTYNPA